MPHWSTRRNIQSPNTFWTTNVGHSLIFAQARCGCYTSTLAVRRPELCGPDNFSILASHAVHMTIPRANDNDFAASTNRDSRGSFHDVLGTTTPLAATSATIERVHATIVVSNVDVSCDGSEGRATLDLLPSASFPYKIA